MKILFFVLLPFYSFSQKNSFNSNLSKDAFYSNFVKVVSDGKLNVGIADRETGIILLKDNRVTYTIETEKGGLMRPDAFLIVETVRKNGVTYPITSAGYGPYTSDEKAYDNKVFASCKITIEPANTGSVVSMEFFGVWYLKNLYTASNTDKANINTLEKFKSTGNFEKSLFESIEKFK